MIKAVSALSKGQKKDIWELIKAADREFVPPLSSRGSTTQADLKDGEAGEVPQEYFSALSEQSFILCTERSHVTGFLSYIPDHPLRAGGTLDIVCDYVSTIIVAPERRGRGITESMYRALFAHRPGRLCATRTWSQNLAHITILSRLGFRLALRLKDDRGEGVDTVYYLRGDTDE